MSPSLPEPSTDARAHSARLRTVIDREIADAGGWIPFSRYMELALYAPGLGYYAAGAVKLGAAGDFVTAPEMTPLFAQTLARQFAELIEASDGEVLELGAGSGRFAADVLVELEVLGALPQRYLILETSPDLRARQRAHLAEAAPRLATRVEWLDALPAQITGVAFGNEVLDAVPCEIVRRARDGWMRCGVAVDRDDCLVWEDRVLDDSALAAFAALRLPDIEGYVSELCPAGEALVRTLCERLARGGLLLIDYGFPRTEYYHPQRSAGTLMCHYRQHVHDDPFFYPGLQDITAHVEFSAVAAAGVAGDAELAGYAPLAQALVNLGITERLQGRDAPGTAAYARRVSPVQRLLHPAEMGELFKAIGFAKAVDFGWRSFREGDQSHRL